MTNTAVSTADSPVITRTSVWRAPFTTTTWARTAYLLAVAPVSLLALAAAVVGRPAAGLALSGRLAEALSVVPSGAAVEDPPRRRVAAHALLGVLLGALSFVITVYGWSLVVLNVAYPIRGVSDLSDAWGGPSIAGAWAVHAAGGLFFLFVVPYVIEGLTAVHRRILRAFGIVCG
jgi:hypothetical protein